METRYLRLRTESSTFDYSETIGLVRKVREALNAGRSINRIVAFPDSVDGFITLLERPVLEPWTRQVSTWCPCAGKTGEVAAKESFVR